MNRYSTLLAILLIVPQFIFAQNFADAFRLSNHQVQGTARSAGMGNAFGALGGDFTSISINPAGSAVYQSGEFVITPGFYTNETKMSLGGNTFTDKEEGFTLNNLGAIGTVKTSRSEAGIISVSYGIGYNRLANFSSNAFANYNQSGVSYLDDITNYANQEALSNAYLEQDIGNVQYRDWPAKLAWDTYLIDPATDGSGNAIDGQYVNILYENEKVDQRKTYMEDGYVDEYVFNVGLNFNHNFFLGATIGIHDVQYEKNSAYDEFLTDNNSFRYSDEYYMEATGFNFKLGAIYKPTQNVRLGLAFHSPTWYEVKEESLLAMDSQLLENHSNYGINNYDYDFNSPMKVVLSGAVLFGKKGLLSVDAEYVDFSEMRYRRGGNGTDNFNDLNSEMGNVFDNALNLRMGGEYRLTKQFTVRAGYELYGNPYKNTMELESSLTDDISTYSLGFGYTVNAFALNVAYTNTTSDISDANVQPNYYLVPRTNDSQKILMTLGFRF
jgi:hypothetical protein